MRIVYLMEGVLYHLRYRFSWSRGYDAYALDQQDELQRCAFLMAHLLFEWVGRLVRKPPSYHVLIVTTGFDRRGSAGVEQVEGWRATGSFRVNPACLPDRMSHRLRMNIVWWCAQGGRWLLKMGAHHRRYRLSVGPHLCRQAMPNYFFLTCKKTNFALSLTQNRPLNSMTWMNFSSVNY